MFNRKRTYRVKSVRHETGDTVTLSLTFADGSTPRFSTGQVIDVFFPETDTSIGKPYSISNEPGAKTLDITVRAIGMFSKKLCSLSLGETFTGSLPYGSFSPRSFRGDLFLICGGVGITSVTSTIYAEHKVRPKRYIHLFYSTKKEDEIIFERDLRSLARVSPYFFAHHFITREHQNKNEFLKNGVSRRLTVDDLSEDMAYAVRPEFLICGPLDFVRDIRRDLLTYGINPQNISTSSTSSLKEAFRTA